MGLLYVLGNIKKKNHFSLTKSPYLFAILVGQLYSRAAVKEIDFRGEAGPVAVGYLRAESELQLIRQSTFCQHAAKSVF